MDFHNILGYGIALAFCIAVLIAWVVPCIAEFIWGYDDDEKTEKKRRTTRIIIYCILIVGVVCVLIASYLTGG